MAEKKKIRPGEEAIFEKDIGKTNLFEGMKIPKTAADFMAIDAGKAGKAEKSAKSQKPKEIAPPGALKPPNVITSEETGKVTGAIMPSGNVYLHPENVREIVQAQQAEYQQQKAMVEGTQSVGAAQQAANRQERLQQLLQMGQQGLLSPQELQAIQEAPIDWGQALTAGSVGNLPSILTRVGAGAGAGAGIGAGIGLIGGPFAPITSTAGAIGGGIIGGIGGLISAMWGGAQSNIKKQQAGQIAKTKDVLAAARTNMRALVMVVSKDPAKAEEAINLYYQQKAQAQKAYRQLQLETQGNLNKYMDDGTQDLSDFELFLQPGGYADIQLIRLQQAAFKGTPATDQEMLQFYEEEFADE